MKKIIACTILAVALLSTAAPARADFSAGYFVTGGVSAFRVGDQSFKADLPGGRNFDLEYRLGWSARVAAGLNFENSSNVTPWFGLEGSYSYAEPETYVSGTTGLSHKVSGDLRILGLTALGGIDVDLPHNLYFSLWGRLGLANYKLSAAKGVTSPFAEFKDNALSTGIALSFGTFFENGFYVQAECSADWIHNLEAAAYSADTTNVQKFGLVVGFFF